MGLHRTATEKKHREMHWKTHKLSKHNSREGLRNSQEDPKPMKQTKILKEKLKTEETGPPKYPMK